MTVILRTVVLGSVFAVLLAALALAAVGPAVAQAPNPGGDVPGRPEIAADSRDCLEHPDWSPAVTCTVLYGHIFNLLDAVPINVQFPDEECPDLARGFTTVPTVGPFQQNRMDLYSSPGFVEYDEGERHDDYCDPILHPERGLTGDVLVSPDVPLAFYWYMSADADDVSVVADPEGVDTGAMPCLTVRVSLQSGRHWGQGTLLAQGEATRSVLSSRAAPATMLPTPDPCAAGDLVTVRHPNLEVAPVHEFPILLGTLSGPLSKVEGYVVHVEWWQVDGPGANQVAQREWNVHSGADHRARLVVPVMNPVEVVEVRPQLFLGTIYVHGVFNSPWGSYDVDPSSLRTEVLDATGMPIEDPAFGEPILVYDVSHEGHFRPVNVTVPWDFLADDLAPGTYTLRMSTQNWQHTATRSNEALVELSDGFERLSGQVAIYSSDGERQRNVAHRTWSDSGRNAAPEDEAAPGSSAWAALLAVVGVAGAMATLRRQR